MHTTFLSLGGGCDTAMALGELGIRQTSYPFDWLWNLDTGLEAVCDIIEDDFQKVLSRDAYTLSPHYRFPGRLSVTYRDYPSIVHVHTDPLRVLEDHETLVRRIQRLRRTLQDAPHLTFVYYRCFEEGRIRRADSTVHEEFAHLEGEAARFLEVISSRRAGKQSRLVLVFQTAPEHQKIALGLVRAANALERGRGQTSYAYTLTRDDESAPALQAWRNQWQSLLSSHGGPSRARLMARRLRAAAGAMCESVKLLHRKGPSGTPR